MARKRSWGPWAAAFIAGASLCTAASAADAPASAALAQMLERLTGAVEQVPSRWGGAEMAPPFDPASTLSTSLYSSVPVPETPPPVAPSAIEPPPSPQSGSVQALEVRARARSATAQDDEKCTSGPAWWRVSDADTVLWILGTPDEIPLKTRWDDTCLERRMAKAWTLVLPNRPRLSPLSPGAQNPTPLRLNSTPYLQRLPAPLAARLQSRIEHNPIRAAAGVRLMGPAATLNLIRSGPNELVPTVVLADRLAGDLRLPGLLGNPVADRAAVFANRFGTFIGRTDLSARQLRTLIYLSPVSEAAAQACLSRVLTVLEGGETGLWRLGQVQAWAAGNYENAPPRMDVMTECNFGDSTLGFWSVLVAQYMDKIDRAMSQPGVAVAVVEFDPLFIRGGVMDRMRERGWTIKTPDQLR